MRSGLPPADAIASASVRPEASRGEVLGREGAGDGAAADAADAELVRLLAEKIHHAQVVLESVAAVVDASGHLDGGEHAQRAIESTAARDRVRVRPRDQQLARSTRQCPHQVAGSVPVNGEAGVTHPRGHPLA